MQVSTEIWWPWSIDWFLNCIPSTPTLSNSQLTSTTFYLSQPCSFVCQKHPGLFHSSCTNFHQIHSTFLRDGVASGPRLSVETTKPTWRWRAVVCGGVIAGPNVFMASMKRPETPIKATNTQRKQQNGNRAACLFLLLCGAASFSVNF